MQFSFDFTKFFRQNDHSIVVWKKREILLSDQFFREINYLFSNCFSKNVIFTIFTKFLSKKFEKEFHGFPQCEYFVKLI